eukprot:SAG22_NODE_10952_length_508_cov_0.506112_1_plen_99_part_10
MRDGPVARDAPVVVRCHGVVSAGVVGPRRIIGLALRSWRSRMAALCTRKRLALHVRSRTTAAVPLIECCTSVDPAYTRVDEVDGQVAGPAAAVMVAAVD